MRCVVHGAWEILQQHHRHFTVCGESSRWHIWYSKECVPTSCCCQANQCCSSFSASYCPNRHRSSSDHDRHLSHNANHYNWTKLTRHQETSRFSVSERLSFVSINKLIDADTPWVAGLQETGSYSNHSCYAASHTRWIWYIDFASDEWIALVLLCCNSVTFFFSAFSMLGMTVPVYM